MIEVITMKDDGNILEKTYSKDAGVSAFILEWIPISVGVTFGGTLMGILFEIILQILTDTGLSREWYLYSLVGFAVALLEGWRRYRLINREFFASVSDETLTLRFGKDSFPWETIQEVGLEGDRKLIIMFLDEGEKKRRLVNLKWLSEKEDFIHTLKDHCTEKKIPYHQGEISFFSRIELCLDSHFRYPHV
jgi:hypothetical protein